MTIRRLKIGLILLFFHLSFTSLYAEEDDNKQGFSMQGEIEVKAQRSSDKRLDEDFPTSLELHGKWRLRRSLFEIKLEGNSDTEVNSITNRVDEGNASSPTGKGRFQISEFKHTLFFTRERRMAYGLIDPEHYLTKYRDYGDETIDIATIDMPDYTLGLVYRARLGGSPWRVTGLLSSSHGLDDNPNLSYSELFDVSESGKGVFYALETRYQTSKTELAFGAWHNRHDVMPLAGGVLSNRNYGGYAIATRKVGRHLFAVRYGWANPRLAEEHQFAGIGYGYRWGAWKLKLDYAYVQLSSDETDPGKDDTQRGQLQIMRKHNDNLSYGLIIQNIRNNEFDSTSTVVDSDITLFAFKIKYEF